MRGLPPQGPLETNNTRNMGLASSVRKVLKPKVSCCPLLQFSRISLSQAENRVDHPRVSPPSVRPSFLPHRRISCSPHLSPTTKTAPDCRREEWRESFWGVWFFCDLKPLSCLPPELQVPRGFAQWGGEEGGARVGSLRLPGSCSSHFRGSSGGCGYQRTSRPIIPQEGRVDTVVPAGS